MFPLGLVLITSAPFARCLTKSSCNEIKVKTSHVMNQMYYVLIDPMVKISSQAHELSIDV